MRGAYAITHWGHTLLVLILLVTGAMIFFPEARLFLFSGYSLVFSQAHRYSGALYIPVTFAFIALAVKNGKLKMEIPASIMFWKKTHLKILLITTFAFALSGIALWFYTLVSVKLLDVSAIIHQIFTLILLMILLIHIILILAKNNINNGVKND